MTKLLTPDELSRFLRVPKRTVYKFAKEGTIPGTIRIGKHWRFCEDSIHGWIAQAARQGSKPQVELARERI